MCLRVSLVCHCPKIKSLTPIKIRIADLDVVGCGVGIIEWCCAALWVSIRFPSFQTRPVQYLKLQQKLTN